MQKSLGHLREY